MIDWGKVNDIYYSLEEGIIYDKAALRKFYCAELKQNPEVLRDISFEDWLESSFDNFVYWSLTDQLRDIGDRVKIASEELDVEQLVDAMKEWASIRSQLAERGIPNEKFDEATMLTIKQQCLGW